jgi:membrane associated rhomboid family serine protease
MPPQLWATNRPLAVRVLVAILCGWGAAQAALWAFGLSDVWQFIALDATAARSGEYWRIITSQLFHANFLHFALTVLVTLIAGREVEPIIGRRPFIAMCVSAGLLGSLANCVAFPSVATSGFSAGAAAIFAAYATILPELEHRFALMLPAPFRIRAKHLATALVIGCVALVAARSLLGIGPAGILAGAGIGWCFARQLGFGNAFWFQRRRMEARQHALRRLRMSPEEFVAHEIDPILEKISRDGVGSLTRAERKILEEGRGKLTEKSGGKR